MLFSTNRSSQMCLHDVVNARRIQQLCRGRKTAETTDGRVSVRADDYDNITILFIIAVRLYYYIVVYCVHSDWLRRRPRAHAFTNGWRRNEIVHFCTVRTQRRSRAQVPSTWEFRGYRPQSPSKI